jgi:RNA-directed DNA polymerase
MTSPSHLKNLRAATSLRDVAQLLGYKPSALSYLLYRLNASQKYTDFEITKRGGGTRNISAPNKRIKQLQRRLANVLALCRKEIESAKDPLPPISHGFRSELSIITNAYPHRGRRYVLNLDLAEFFPSINFGRVRGFFIHNRDYGLKPAVATVLAQIACHSNYLPQGSPCSPIISDLVASVLDVRLVRLAKRYGCYYTRYADDLTFSTNNKAFPPEIAHQSTDSGSSWILGSALVSTIERTGFSINPRKTRMQTRTGRQLVTGLTVNQKVNIRADYYRTARAMCHRLFMTGEYQQPLGGRTVRKRKKPIRFYRGKHEKRPPARMLSRLAWRILEFARTFWKRPTASKLPTKPLVREALTTTRGVGSLKELEGIIGHIYHVKDKFDLRKTDEKKSKPTAIRRLFHQFLFFKYFVGLSKPLVICEGKTDSIYLKLAVRSLIAGFPVLDKSRPEFFNYRAKRNDVLKIEGGTGSLLLLIKDYAKLMKNYRFTPLLHPVIILIDNDDGADNVFKTVRSLFGTKIDLTTTDPFYHLCHNLYLIKTPEMGAKGKSCIEDLFEQTVRDIQLGGCKFNPNKEHGAPGEYGKALFAEQVVVPNSTTINFTNFSSVLSRIEKVLKHYVPPAPTTAVLAPTAATATVPTP